MIFKKLLKLSLITCLLFCTFNSFGQAGDYSFSVSTSAFTPLGTGATRLTVLEGDDEVVSMPLGFTFEFEGAPYTTAVASSNGFLSFNAGAGSNLGNNLSGGPNSIRPLIAPLWDDLDGGNVTTTRALYETSGTSPNRVFTIEYRDWSWNWQATVAVVSFQIKLYETTNEVEFHYDLVSPASINSPSASIGLSGVGSFLSVYDTSATPVVSKLTEFNQIDSVVTGRVFSFLPPSCVAPAGGTFSFIGTDSVQFNFFSGTSAGPFEVEFGPVGFTQGTNSSNFITVTDTFANINSLAAATTYEIYVRLDCGGGSQSGWAGPFAFTTNCVPLNAPFVENFDGSGWVSGTGSTNAGDALGNCWSRSANSGFFWGTRSGSTGSGSTGPSDDFNVGGNYVFTETSSGSTGDSVYLTSPFINISSLTTPFLSFYYHLYGATMGTLYVEINDGTGWQNNIFNISGQQQSSSAAPFIKGFVNISNLTLASDTIQFRFLGVKGTSFTGDMAIDQVRLDEAPTCTEPLLISGAFVSRDSIVVRWDSIATAYNVEYGPSGFALNTGTTVAVTDTFAGIGGLMPNTTYDFYVISDCSGSGNGLSLPTGPAIITTLCNALSVPFTETFNSTSVTENCWTVLDVNNDGRTWDLDRTFNTLNGDQTAYIGAGFTPNNNDWMISPALSFTGNEQLAYYYRAASSFSPSEFMVLVSTTGVNPADFQDTIIPLRTYNSTTYQRETVDMSLFNSDIYIAWVLPQGTVGGSGIYIDSVLVEALPPCPAPSLLTASNISAFQADLGWTNPNATAWNIEIGPAGFIQGSGTVTAVTSNPYTAMSLTQNTCYDYYVQRDCGANGLSSWAGPFNFCTPPTCPAPTNLGVDPTSLTINSASIYFTPGVATNFNVEFGASGFTLGTGNHLQVTNDTVLLSGLSSGTEYEFYVRDSCSATDTSTWAGPISFVTPFNTNYLQDFNAGGQPFGWIEAKGLLTSNTTFTSAFSSWGPGPLGDGTLNSTSATRANIWTTNQFEWNISPSIYLNPTSTNLQVEFDAAVMTFSGSAQGYFDADDSLSIVISTDNGATWSNTNVIWTATAGDTINVAGEHIIVPLTGYSGYVRFGIYGTSKVGAGADNYFSVDNFEVRTPRACATPTLDSIAGVTTTSASVYWTNGAASASSWDIILTSGSQPASAGVVTTVATSGSYSFTNLTNATAYCVYLVETCINGISDTAGPICFSTPCLPTTLPYLETFTNSLGCFTAIDGGATPDTWTWVSNYVDFTGSQTVDGQPGFALLDDDGAGSAALLDNEIIESVTIDASVATAPVILEFDHYYRNIGNDSVAVDVFNGTSWNTVVSYNSTQGAWGLPAHDSIDISAFTSSNMKVRFRYHDGGSWAWYWAVDNIEIYESSACVAPANLDTVSVACDAASVTWVSNASSLSSIVEYGPAGFTLGAGIRTANATAPFAITSLTPSTAYEFYVRSVCAAPDSSTWSGPFAFTTDVAPTITAAFTSNQTTATLTSAKVDFDASTSVGATAYAWDFGNGQTGTGVNASATYAKDSSYTVCLVITGTCGSVDSICNTVIVQGVSLEENAFSTVLTLFPNPSKGVFNLSVGNSKKRFDVEILDLSGRVIYRATNLEPKQNHLIDVTGEAAGLYMISVKGEGVLMNRRIVIEK